MPTPYTRPSDLPAVQDLGRRGARGCKPREEVSVVRGQGEKLSAKMRREYPNNLYFFLTYIYSYNILTGGHSNV